MVERERTEVLIVGAGQAGLAAGYHVQRRGIDVRILEAEPRVGDQWRRRYDSLTLYSPARDDVLPGMPMPLPRGLDPSLLDPVRGIAWGGPPVAAGREAPHGADDVVEGPAASGPSGRPRPGTRGWSSPSRGPAGHSGRG